MVMAHGQPRHGDRQHRPRRRRREPAARPEQRPGLVRHGLVPARVLGLPPRLATTPCAARSRTPGACRSRPSRACASPTCSTPRIDGSFKGLYVQGEDIAQSDPNTQHVTAALAAMECVVVQDLFLNETAKLRPRVPARHLVPGEGRHLHQRRAPDQPRAQGDAAAWRQGTNGRSAAELATRWATRCATRHPSEIMDEIARLTPTFAGVSYEKLDELGSIQWPCNDAGARGHADHARSTASCAARASSSITEYVADRRADRAALPAAAHHRPHPLASTTSARRRGAPTTSSGTTRTCSRSTPTTPRTAASATATGWRWRAAPARPRCAPGSPSGCSRAWSTRPSTIPLTGANVITTDNSDWATNCPEYKVTAVEVRLTNQLSRSGRRTMATCCRLAASRQ